MSNVITLTARSDYATAGKQNIGRVTGPSERWGFALDFVGTRAGKRGDVTTAKITQPGLYRVHDTTRKGTTDTFSLIWRDGESLDEITVSESVAAEIACGDMSAAALNARGVRLTIEHHESRILAGEGKDPEEPIDVQYQIGPLAPGKHPRGAVWAARRVEISRLRGDATPERPIELDGGPSDPSARRRALEQERARLVARIAEIEIELWSVAT